MFNYKLLVFWSKILIINNRISLGSRIPVKKIDFQMKIVLQFLKLKKLLQNLLYVFFPCIFTFVLYNHIANYENLLPPR